AGGRVQSAFVADRHVHHRTRHVAAARAPDLERTGVAVHAADPARVARVDAGTAAAAVVGLGRAFRAARAAVGERHVAAVRVVDLVPQVEHVRVGVGRVRQAVHAVAGKAERIGPGVFAVVLVAATGTGSVAALGAAAVAVDVDDPAGGVGILVGELEDGPGVGAAAAVGIGHVAADGFVQRAAQLAGARGVHLSVVPAAAAAAVGVLHAEGHGGAGFRGRPVEVHDPAGVDLQRAGRARDQRAHGAQGEAGRLGDVVQRRGAAAGHALAAEAEGARLDDDRFAEGDRHVGGVGEVARARRREGVDHGRRGIAGLAEGLAVVAGAEG